MADAVIKLNTVVDATTATSTTWVDLATLAATDFVANKTYLILANQIVKSSNASEEARIRLVHGTTPTVFDDASLASEMNVTTPPQEHESSFMFFYTQPATAELIKLQISTSATATVTNILSQVFALKLSDDFTENTDYFKGEDLVDYTMTTTPTAKAITGSFTPNGSDRWLFIGHMIWDVITIIDNMGFELYDSVAGVLSTVWEEGEDATNEFRASNLLWAGVPTNVARTLAVRPRNEGGSNVMLASRVFAINLSKFAQSASAFDATPVDPADAPSWSTVATVSPTPTTTGDWVYLGFGVNDVNAITTDALQTRLQINPDGVGLVSNPNYTATPPGRSGWDNLDFDAINVFGLATFNSGAARTINFDVTQSAGTVARMQNNGLVAFSVALAGPPPEVTIAPHGPLLTGVGG